MPEGHVGRIRRIGVLLVLPALAALAAVSCSSESSDPTFGTIPAETTTTITALPPPESTTTTQAPPEESAPEPEVVTTAPEEPAEPEFHEPADPLPADPELRVGVLDNGLTYYLRYNDRPGGSLSIRLVVKAGSINEPAPGLGTAHFLEHMLFRGTSSYTGNSLELILRDLGVELGPDLNAYAGYEETVYDLTLAPDAPANVTIAFHALSQMAHAATLDPGLVETERGVVLDEMRSARETSYGYVSSQFDRIYTQGTPFEGRDPLGGEDSIESMTADDLRSYYETWYVPSNMAVVAVGDWPVDDLEALVTEHFGSLPAGGAPPLEVPETAPDPRPSYYTVVDEGQGFSYISLDIPIPLVDAGTYGGERQLVMEDLIQKMIRNRLDEAYYRGDLYQVDRPDFHSFTHNRSLRYYGTNWQGENLDTASADYWSVLLTAQEHGFTDADLEHAVEQLFADLEYQLERSSTANDQQFAQRYTSHFLYGADVGTAVDRFERITALLDELTPEDLTDHYRWLMERAGPIVIAVGPDADSIPTEAELEAAISAASPRSEPPRIAPDIEELMVAPSPAEPTAVRYLPVLDGVEWEFANGARVMFVYSDIDVGTVDLQTLSLGGWSLLEPGARALSPRAVGAVTGSGLGDLTKPQLNRFLDERNAAVDAFIGETVEGFSGRASSDDAHILFQLLHLLVTAPRVDEVSFRQALNEAEIRTSLAEVNPGWQAWTAYNEARYEAEWHRPAATREQLESLTADYLLDIYRGRLGDVDNMVVAVVGDIDLAEVELWARHYIGTLPAGEAETYIDRRPAKPGGVVRREVAVGEDESAVLDLYHEAERPVTTSEVVAAAVLERVLDSRLFQRIREELGASYNTPVSVGALRTPRPVILSEITVTSDPDRLEEIHAEVLSILADVAAEGLSTGELQQAKAVLERDYGFFSNADLLAVLVSRLYLDDDDLPTSDRLLAELREIDAAAVQELAADLYGQGDRIEIIRAPETPA